MRSIRQRLNPPLYRWHSARQRIRWKADKPETTPKPRRPAEVATSHAAANWIKENYRELPMRSSFSEAESLRAGRWERRDVARAERYAREHRSEE